MAIARCVTGAHIHGNDVGAGTPLSAQCVLRSGAKAQLTEKELPCPALARDES